MKTDSNIPEEEIVTNVTTNDGDFMHKYRKVKTSVDWLYEEIHRKIAGISTFEGNLLEHAKKMHRREIEVAHGNKECKSGGVVNYTYTKSGQDYYNETYE